MLRRTGSIKRSALKKHGAQSRSWTAFSQAKAQRDLNEDGLLKCQDYRLGLPPCGIARLPGQMDLHHIYGRAGKLLFDEQHMVWLTRECHQTVHTDTNIIRKTKDENSARRQGAVQEEQQGDDSQRAVVPEQGL